MIRLAKITTLSRIACSLAIVFSCCCISAKVSADIIDVDRTGVDPAYAQAFKNAEAFWESRIQNYSTDLPRALLVQLSSLRILATTPPIDGPGGVLGAAGPDAVLSFQHGDLFSTTPIVVPVLSSMFFDIDDLPQLEADGILESVIIHEMGHALGFGSLWVQNELIEPLGGVGLTQYTGGEYAIRGYGQDIGSPVASFVPLEQRGGAGTALAHWFDAPPFFNQVFTPAFTKEIMTGFACDLDPATGLIVCAPTFASRATWGAMADLGYEVAGVNDNAVDPPASEATGRWPKVTGSGFDPFRDNGIAPAAGLEFNLVNIRVVTRSRLGDGGGSAPSDVASNDSNDPYRLRGGRWVK